MNIENKKNEQHSHFCIFRFLYHRTQINWGSKCKDCKISRLLVNKFLILVVVIYFLTFYTKLRPRISYNTTFGLALSLVYFFMSVFLRCKECKIFFHFTAKNSKKHHHFLRTIRHTWRKLAHAIYRDFFQV